MKNITGSGKGWMSDRDSALLKPKVVKEPKKLTVADKKKLAEIEKKKAEIIENNNKTLRALEEYYELNAQKEIYDGWVMVNSLERLLN